MTDVKIIIKTIDESSTGIKTITAQVQGLEKALGTAGKTSKTAGDGISNAGLKFTELKSKVDLATGALGMVVDVLKATWDAAKQGAALNQITESFDRMNASVYKSPDLLEKMTEASRGTIGQADLMRGMLLLTAGASDELARAFSDAAPQLLEIAKASNKLNPSLGDTAYLYESISRGVKRGSSLILDNLGIVVKVGEANEKYAQSIGKTVKELTAEDKQMALLNATLEAGDKLIGQVGGNVDAAGDSFARLEVIVQGNINKWKQLFADGIVPVLEALSSMNAGTLDDTIQKNIETAQSIDELVESAQKMVATQEQFGAGAFLVTGTLDSLKTGLRDTALAIAENSDGYEDAKKNLEAAFGPDIFQAVDEGLVSFIDLGNGVSIYVDQIKRAANPTTQFSNHLEELARMGREAAQGLREVIDELPPLRDETGAWLPEIQKDIDAAYEAEGAFLELGYGAATLAGHMVDLQINTGLTAEELEELEEALKAARAATGDYFVAALEAERGAGFFNEALSDLGNHSAFVSNMTAEQKSDLELLTDAYDKAADKLHSYELGIGTTGMEQDNLSDKMSEQQAIMDELGPKIAQLNTVGGEYVSWTTEATINQDAVNTALFDAVDAAGGSAEQLAILGGALGLYSEDAVEAALKSAAIQTAISGMAQQFVDGQITVGDMNTAIQDLITRLENPPPPLILETNIAEAMEGLSDADAKLAEKLGVFTEESQGMATDAQTAFGDIAGAAEENMPNFETAVNAAMESAALTTEENMAIVQSSVDTNLSAALTIAEGYPPQFGAVGTNIGQTMASSLLAEGGALSNAAGQIVANALEAAAAAAGIESPSKVAMWQMSQIIEGYLAQARAQGGSVADALEDMINGAFDQVGDSISAASTFQRAADFFGGMLEDGGGGGMEQQLAFLQQQARILETIRDLGLDPSEILGGIQLGLGADVQALLDATNAALAGLIEGIDSGLGEAQDAAESGLDALAEAIRRHEEQIADAFDAVGDSLSAGSTFGRVSQFFADMLFPDNSEAMSAVEGRIADAFGGQLPDLEKNFDELMGYAQSTGQKQLIADLEEYRRLQDERNEAEKKMLEIQKQQQQLNFLQSQLDLLQMIQDAGLNPAEVLNGIQLGLGADIEDLLAASQAAMNAMIAQANGQLGGLQGILGGGIMTAGMGNALTAATGGGLWAGPPGQATADTVGGGMSIRDINIYLTAPNTGNPYLFGREVGNQVANRLGVRG